MCILVWDKSTREVVDTTTTWSCSGIWKITKMECMCVLRTLGGRLQARSQLYKAVNRIPALYSWDVVGRLTYSFVSASTFLFFLHASNLFREEKAELTDSLVGELVAVRT